VVKSVQDEAAPYHQAIEESGSSPSGMVGREFLDFLSRSGLDSLPKWFRAAISTPEQQFFGDSY
jgi:hypothetical protein